MASSPPFQGSSVGLESVTPESGLESAATVLQAPRAPPEILHEAEQQQASVQPPNGASVELEQAWQSFSQNKRTVKVSSLAALKNSPGFK